MHPPLTTPLFSRLAAIIAALLLNLTATAQGGTARGSERMTCEELTTLMYHYDSLRMAGHYDEVRQELGHVLVRASALVDTCGCASYLFSTLAMAYEQTGDTILPPHLHRKAQELAVVYEGYRAAPDSVEAYRLRVQTLHEILHQSSHAFSPDNMAYIESLVTMASWMYHCGNTLEVISLGDEALRLARQVGAADHEVMNLLPGQLVCSLAWENEMGRVAELLPWAEAFYAGHPEVGLPVRTLYLLLGDKVAARRDYAAALPFLRKAEQLFTDHEEENYLYLQELIKLCQDNL